jgi:uncharacterized protein (DUF1778 family)
VRTLPYLLLRQHLIFFSGNRRKPMGATMTKPRAARGTNINMRISQADKDLIARGAKASRKSLSDFVTDSALHAAEEALLDQRIFALDSKQFAAFEAVLNSPPPPNAALKSLLQRRAPWER